MTSQKISPVLGGWYQGEGRGDGQRVSIVGILCTHVCKWKNETSQEWREGRIKKNGGGGEFKSDMFDTL
jgi:hypothetical protein